MRHRPQLLHERLTTRGLKQDRQKTSLARTVKWIVGIFLLLLILLVVVSASFAGTTGVLLDLSDSTTSMTFAKNLRAVEQVIRTITSTRSRIVVFGITKSSFNRHPLLDETSPAVRGRFAEYVEEWQLKTLRTWRMKQTAFKLDAAGSDIIGALARIALEFQEVPQGEKRLVLLSDMRQVGKGLNFERSVGKPERLIHGVEKQALIPNLNAVRVWILGVHTSGVDERQWLTIRKFWVGFLEKAGAKLEAFSPNRDLKEW